jgi:arylsulfatase A-like enzyme
MPTDRNIVVICLDTVRKDYFNRHATQLKKLSDVSFEECRAASSWTLPSHASMFTGELSHNHGVHIQNRDFSTIDISETFLNEMTKYRTVGLSANFHAGPKFGFDRFFDDFIAVNIYRKFNKGMDVREFIQNSDNSGIRAYLDFLKMASKQESTTKSILNGASSKLNQLSRKAPIPSLFDEGTKRISKKMASNSVIDEEPFFVFANYMESHEPYEHTIGYDSTKHDASNTWSSHHLNVDDLKEIAENNAQNHRHIQNFRNLYASAIDYMDRHISRAIEKIRERTTNETTFIITADHGENLGYTSDDYLFGHWDSMTEALLHVPFDIINPPSGYERNEHRYFTHLDLGDFILGLSRDETPNLFRDVLLAERPGSYTYQTEERVLRTFYRDSKKVVWDSLGNVDVYQIDPAKPSKQHSVELDSMNINEVESYFDIDIDVFAKAIQQTEDSTDLNEMQRQQLEDLGYL